MAVTQGHEKISVCGLFVATASGRKLPWICLIDRDPSNPVVGLRAPEGCILAYCKKGKLKVGFLINQGRIIYVFGQLGLNAHINVKTP